jgi:hypothetical protein
VVSFGKQLLKPLSAGLMLLAASQRLQFRSSKLLFNPLWGCRFLEKHLFLISTPISLPLHFTSLHLLFKFQMTYMKTEVVRSLGQQHQMEAVA